MARGKEWRKTEAVKRGQNLSRQIQRSLPPRQGLRERKDIREC